MDLSEAKKIMELNKRFYDLLADDFSRVIKYSWLKIVGKSKLDWGDFYESWGEKGLRYFHSFTRKELSNLFKEVGFQVENIEILNRRSGERNIVVIARKQL